MSQVLRYDDTYNVVTALNPIEDMVTWIAGLRSIDYVSDVVRDKHHTGRRSKIEAEATRISLLAGAAVDLMDQGFSGQPEVSFLPLYYALHNLSKIYIVLAGNLRSLDDKKHRYHGAAYLRRSRPNRHLLAEQIKLQPNGVLGQFYDALTGQQWVKSPKIISLHQIYPFLARVSHEFTQAFGIPYGVQDFNLYVENVQPDRYRLRVDLGKSSHPKANNQRCMKLFSGFRRLNSADPSVLVNKTVSASQSEEAHAQLAGGLHRHLIYHSRSSGRIVSQTALCTGDLHVPEELPIWMAMFHLSNIARYDPEYLYAIASSRAWPVLLALRRHGVLQFLILFWSHLHQTNYNLVHE